MKLKYLIALLAITLLTFTVSAQRGGTEHRRVLANQELSRVNPATLGVELELPLIAYPGRGSNVAVTVSYSSDVWRFRRSGPTTITDGCVPVSEARFSDNSASGWTTSLAVPFVEYVGLDDRYGTDGKPAATVPSPCEPTASDLAWVRRIRLHLPGGKTHELRMDDEVLVYPQSSQCRDSVTQPQCSSNDPALPSNSSGWYYAVDGSNIRYFEDRAANTYFAHLPDGSRYDFSSATSTGDSPTVRKAIVRTDRNGNTIVFHDATDEFPNGRWTDSVGRSIPAPFLPTTPAVPGDRTIEFPSMDDGVSRFVFRWKRLKGATPGESAIDDFGSDPKLVGDRVFSNGCWRTSDQPALFTSVATAWIGGPAEPFNPVLLTEIELPSGTKYSFKYNNFGEMVRAELPAGGYESFEYGRMQTESDGGFVRGVTRHVVSAGDGIESEWNYSGRNRDAMTVRTETLNPDGVRVVRFINRGSGDTKFGFGDVLAGTVAEERIYAASGRLAAIRTANWIRTEFSRPFGMIGRNPRVTSIESLIRVPSGGQLRSVESMSYANDEQLGSPDQPLLIRSLTRTFSGAGAADTKTLEFAYVVDDPTIPAEIRSGYQTNGLAGLVGSVSVFDSNGALVSKAFSRYDEPRLGPRGPRGNRTSWGVWERSTGDHETEVPTAGSTARFDDFGNAVEIVDPSGKIRRATFDERTHSLPIRVTSIDPGHGIDSDAGSTIENRFDAVSGILIWNRAANGRETKFRYEPETRRLTGSWTLAMGDEPETVTELTYRDTPGSFQISRRTRADADHWSEATASLDGLGRPVRIEQSSPGGTTFIDAEFDAAGRIGRLSDPYRRSEKPSWTTYLYDESGRGVELIGPDGKRVPIDWGVIMGDLGRTDWGVIMGDLGRPDWGVIMGDLSRTDWGVIMGDLSRTDWGVLVGDIARTDWGVLVGDLARSEWGVLVGDFTRTDRGVIFGDLSRTDWGVIMGDLTRTDRGVLVGDLSGSN